MIDSLELEELRNQTIKVNMIPQMKSLQLMMEVSVHSGPEVNTQQTSL